MNFKDFCFTIGVVTGKFKGGDQMRILLVEDEMRLREALTHMLKKKGYAVDSAADGDSGMEMAAGGIYDILVLDRMRDGTGYPS